MTAHFEIVRAADLDFDTAPTQPFHARVCASNGELVWSTETYVAKDGARGGIGQLVSMLSPVHKASVYADHVDMWLDDEELGDKFSVPIVEVDLRHQQEHTRFDNGHAVGGVIPHQEA